MSAWPVAPLGRVATFIRGVTFKPTDVIPLGTPGSVACMRTKNVQAQLDLSDVWALDRASVRRTEQLLRTGDILVSSANSLNLVGKCCWVPELPWPTSFGGFISVLRADPDRIHPRFLFRWFASDRVQTAVRSFGQQTTNISNLNVERTLRLVVPVPPLSEQRRIAELLDCADELRAKRRAALAQLDTLTESIFLDMFGDAALNPKHWPRMRVGDLAIKFSDGPFGSNLKSAHYTEGGVRVVRLQNIGVGEFLDNDRAFISEQHFRALKKHECRPGDVLIGTMGEPNLRACIQPEWLQIALNKADCVQLRPNQKVATAAYISSLLNQPATERLARGFILGQTRLRISMGRLRELQLPVPPLGLQQEFESRAAAVERLKAVQRVSLAELDALFASLQHRAFRGEL